MMNKYEKLSTILSIFAALVSCLSIYFQFVYKHSSIILSAVETQIRPDSSYIESIIVYTNDGNQYSTITRNDLAVYQEYENGGEIDTATGIIKPWRSLLFLTKWGRPVDPVILSPGQQVVKKMRNNLDPDMLKSIKDKFGVRKQISVGVSVDYLNSYGQPVNELVELGWIMLEDDITNYKWRFEYPYIELEDSKVEPGAYSQSPNTPIEIESE